MQVSPPQKILLSNPPPTVVFVLTLLQFDVLRSSRESDKWLLAKSFDVFQMAQQLNYILMSQSKFMMCHLLQLFMSHVALCSLPWFLWFPKFLSTCCLLWERSAIQPLCSSLNSSLSSRITQLFPLYKGFFDDLVKINISFYLLRACGTFVQLLLQYSWH